MGIAAKSASARINKHDAARSIFFLLIVPPRYFPAVGICNDIVSHIGEDVNHLSCLIVDFLLFIDRSRKKVYDKGGSLILPRNDREITKVQRGQSRKNAK